MDRVALARQLTEHVPADAREEGHRDRVLSLLADTEAPFSRAQCEPGHVTGSAFVLSPDGRQVLLIFHGKLARWLQPGGHVDADDADLIAAARRELREETGLQDVVLAPGFPLLWDVDVHDIPANPRKGEGVHQHFDVRVLFRARTWEVAAGGDAVDARWVPLEDVASLETDASVLRAVEKLQARVPGAEDLREAPATARNREPLLRVLQEVVPAGARVLEVASGTGEHAAWLAAQLDVRVWQPSDRSEEALRAVEARVAAVPNVAAPVRVDAAAPPWEAVAEGGWDVVLCVNMVHISPWETTEGLLAGAVDVLANDGRLVLYGPYRALGQHTAPSNEAFDASLRERDTAWGVRDLEAVVSEAARHGLVWERTVPMPANNLVVVFRRDPTRDPRIDEVLEAWFGPEDEPTADTRRSWWVKDEAQDAYLRERFGALHEDAAEGKLDGWAASARGRLALIVVLDQWSRQIHRDTAGMFAQDAAAVHWTLDGLRRGMDAELALHERLFFLMPLMHAEDVGLQQLSVAAFRALAEDARAQGDDRYDGNRDFAERHRAIVVRFGRYPHRNAVLSRETTPEEAAFLQQPGSSF